ncbi:MAG TPA: hypothetical protein VGH66_13955 [Acidimicrobiales bacterium]|jgi:hypothetical protein
MSRRDIPRERFDRDVDWPDPRYEPPDATHPDRIPDRDDDD